MMEISRFLMNFQNADSSKFGKIMPSKIFKKLEFFESGERGEFIAKYWDHNEM